jgi:hypothetical protein
MTETMTPAQELRAAAAKIRDAKHWASPGPWVAYTDEVCTDWHPSSEAYRQINRDIDVAHDTGPGNAAHIALWHPGVAELVAVILDAGAGVAEDEGAIGTDIEVLLGEELALARAINGGVR